MYFLFLNEELFRTPESSKSQGRQGKIAGWKMDLFEDVFLN